MADKNAPLDLFAKDNMPHIVRLCPVCGSMDLTATILTSVNQNPDGTWEMVMVDPEDIRHEMSNVNTEIRCTNQRCGAPLGPDGSTLPLFEGESLEAFWIRSKGFSSDVSFDDLSEADKAEYLAWETEIYWVPFRGVINDCPIL